MAKETIKVELANEGTKCVVKEEHCGIQADIHITIGETQYWLCKYHIAKYFVCLKDYENLL